MVVYAATRYGSDITATCDNYGAKSLLYYRDIKSGALLGKAVEIDGPVMGVNIVLLGDPDNEYESPKPGIYATTMNDMTPEQLSLPVDPEIKGVVRRQSVLYLD